MSDLISRQQAIDAVDAIGHIATMPDGDKCIRRSAVKYTLSMLPSAQTVATDTNVGDTISRHDAIDALNEYFSRIGKLKRRGLAEGEKAISLDTVGAIKTLPPVQPEPHEGEWIPVHPIQSDDPGAYMCSKCKTGMWEIRPSAYHYCPNCGAKMTIPK